MTGGGGPRDLPVFWYLPQNGLWIILMMDVLHRCPRDMCEAAKYSNNWSMILDTTTVLNYDHGLSMCSKDLFSGIRC